MEKKICIPCEQPTDGSVGAAGLKWPGICQSCKDKEDSIAIAHVKHIAKSTDMLMESMFGGHNEKANQGC